MLTLAEIIKDGRLQGFIYEEARGVGPIDRAAFDAPGASVMKQHKTAEQLEELVTEYVEKRYRGEMSGTKAWRVVRLAAPNDGSNWKIAHSGHGAGFGHALDEAERHLRNQFDLADG